MRHPRRVVIVAMAAMLCASAIDSGWAQCDPVPSQDDFIYRFGVAGDLAGAELLPLLNTPTLIRSEASLTAPGDGAAVRALSEVHVLYPVEAEHLDEVLRDEARLPQIIPDLAVNETVCQSGPDDLKQFQRTEFNVLFLTFGTEYLIDVHFALHGPEEYGSYWSMYESLDGRMTYLYGSWYFRNVDIEGRQYAYMRHFSLTGMARRIPGFRPLFEAQALGRVAETMEAVYVEAVSRYGTTK